MKEKILIDEFQLYDNFRQKIIDLIDLMKTISPYQLLSNAVNYYKGIQIISQNYKEHNNDNVTLKFTFEFLQMMYSLIREEDLNVQEADEKTFHEILKLVQEINSLMFQYVFMKTTDDKYNIPEEQKEYIFSNFTSLNITGKRYDIFENEHHRNVLEPLKMFFLKAYNFEIDKLYRGIDKLKYNFIFGLNDSQEQMQKIIEKNFDCNEDKNIEFSEEQLKSGEDIVYNIIGLELHNVQKICDWNIDFVELFSLSLGDNYDILNDISINKIIDLYSQINSKPIIKLENNYYCLNPQRLFDNIDRIIIKDLYKKHSKNKQEINKLVSDNCENLTAKMFNEIMPNAKIDLKNYYKISTGFAENDLLIEYDKNLLIIEVKSGSFTPDVAINNIDSHIASLASLVEKGDTQANNFYEILQKNGFVDLLEENKSNSKVKRKISLSEYHNIYRFVVTLEAFNEIESRVEKLKIITVNKDALVICLDDLRVYKDYFKDNPLEFFHYINQRLKATRNKKLFFNDELDHLGMYIEHNDYVMFLNDQIKSYKNIGYIYCEEPRLKIDEYYNGKYFKKTNNIKPVQKKPRNLQDIINFCNSTTVDNSSVFFSNALNLCSDAKDDIFTKQLNELFKTNILENRYRIMGLGMGEFFAIICLKYNDKISLDDFNKRIYANMLLAKEEKGYAVFLYYNLNKEIKNIIIKQYDISEVENREEIEKFTDVVKKTRTILPTKKMKIGRNEQCPCGSGKKYKYCCLNK